VEVSRPVRRRGNLTCGMDGERMLYDNFFVESGRALGACVTGREEPKIEKSLLESNGPLGKLGGFLVESYILNRFAVCRWGKVCFDSARSCSR
jgi:hypothetical protein